MMKCLAVAVIVALVVQCFASEPTPEGYTHRTGDCIGNDISKNALSVAECARNCNLIGHCKSFLYNSIGNYCFLKNSACPQLIMQGTSNYHFYTKTGLTAPTQAPTGNVPVNGKPTMRIGVFVTPDALSVWQTKKQGTFATFKSAMQGTAQSEVSGVFRTSEGFPWNVDVKFVSVQMVSQSQVNQWMQVRRNTDNPSNMASDFCKYVNGVKGNNYDIGMLIVSKAEKVNNALPPAATASIGTICKPADQNVNCLFVTAQIHTSLTVPLWHMLLAHELGHLLGGWHPKREDLNCHDIMANPHIKSPSGKKWGTCSTNDIKKVQSSGGLGCIGL